MLIQIDNYNIKRTTEKAILITQGGNEYWIPLKAVFKQVNNNLILSDWYLKMLKDDTLKYTKVSIIDFIDKTRKPLQELINEKSSNYFPIEAMKHQEECFKWAINKKCIALFNEMGTGKSKLYIDIANYHYSCGSINRVIYYAPVTTLDNFKNEISLWQNSNLHWEIRSINSLSIRLGEKLNKIADDIKPTDMIIIDESHRIKNINSLMSKACAVLGRKTNYKIIGTGTSAPNYALDLIGQFRFLTPQEFNISDNQLKKRYLKIGDNGIVLGSKNDLHILNITYPYTYSIQKKDCLNLPQQIFNTIKIQDKNLQNYYKNIATELSSDFINSKGSLMGFLQNLRKASTGRDKLCKVDIKNPKIEALKDILKDLPTDKKVIIWHSFYYEMEDILEAIDENYVVLNGSQNDHEKAIAIDEFKNNDNIKYLISTTATGGVGLNFTESSINIYFSNDFNLINRLQSSSRIHRIGQNEQCIYYDLINNTTIDNKIMNSILKKEDFMQEILKIYKEKGEQEVVEELQRN